MLIDLSDVAIGDRNKQDQVSGMYVQRSFYKERLEEWNDIDRMFLKEFTGRP